MRSNLEQSIRVFRSDFLESLTHVHPIMPLLVWSPLVVVRLWRSAVVHQIPGSEIAGMAVLGVLTWTLIEYTAHRFLFHFKAEHRVTKFLVFLFHGIHHEAPQDKTRLVMPPVGAAIILAILWSLFALVIPSPWIEPFIAFFAIGYLTYDYTHYAVHHFPMRNRLAHFLKYYHMQHHFQMPDRHFGVSSPLWDWVFRTK
jgi:dihydroceramide fatty acyl 2-hydroxylase